MVKFNRIGNKLGLAGLLGVLLSAGMVVNQMVSDSTVSLDNQRAEGQQLIAGHALEADVGLRRMQLAGRDIRLSRSLAETEKGLSDLNEAHALAAKQLDIALGYVTKPDNRERFQKILSLAAEYKANASELQKTQLTTLEINNRRNDIAGHWAALLKTQLASTAVNGAANRLEIEKALYEADTIFNAMRAAIWRFSATEEDSQKDVINHLAVGLNEVIIRSRSLSGDKALQSIIEPLAVLASDYVKATGEALLLDPVKKELVEVKTLPVGNQALGLMRAAVDTAEKLTEEAKNDAAAEMRFASRVSFASAIIVMMTLIGSVIFTFVGVARPLTRLNGALGKMAAGELNVEIPGASRGDEVGDMAKTVVVIRENAEQKARVEAEVQANQDKIAAEQRKRDMHKLADAFEGAVGEIVETVSSASTELEASASTLTSTATRTQELTTMVAAASEEASTNVQSVASATEELTSSVNEISRQVQESARMAHEAVEQARKTNGRVGELSQAANRIGDVVELISTIAGQTNLLALNATIEAARAGDAGRGFAVVASEVKALAEQTAKATGEIGQQITNIQAATQESVHAIKEISGTIERLSEISATIASAVEEQGAATQEISRNVQQAAQGTMEVSSNITHVQRGASETGSASSQVLSAAQSLSSDSNRLKLEVGKFLNSVRTA